MKISLHLEVLSYTNTAFAKMKSAAQNINQTTVTMKQLDQIAKSVLQGDEHN